jgi:serine/threonine protein kinase
LSKNIKVNESEAKEYKLYIDEKWYIPIDENGYTKGTCYEGALGVVIQLKNDRGGVYALKIPRLLADTLKENAYICELLNEEEKNVTEIFTTQDDIGRDGLLRGSLLSEKIIQKPIQSINSTSEEARKQNGQIIAVQYNKGKMPRFCGIKLDEDGEIKIFPEGVKLEELPLENKKDFEKLKKNAMDGNSPWQKTIVLYEPIENRRVISYLDVLEFLKEENEYNKLWYVGLPSIVYEWGNSTLSEVIINRKNKDWNLINYLELNRTLLDGLNSLHHRNIIHSDIRPANIMYMGNYTNPKNYKLIDYGSFNKHDVGIIDGNKVSDEHFSRILGPTLSKERTSPFYAPERKSDIERENADTAVFVNNEDDTVRILLGWRGELLEEDSVKEEVIENIKGFKYPKELEENPKYDSSLLIPGDKIQIREYIFQIEDIGITESGNKILLCSKHYWKIFHGKIIIASKEIIETGAWMSIPRTTELRQWSFATDIYGVGAIFLYTLFFGGLEKDELQTAENQFAEMLSELDSIPFFKNMWVDLAPLCAQIDKFYEEDTDKSKIENFIFNPEDYLDFAKDMEKDNIQKKSFLEYAKYITFLITYSVKETRKILKLLNYNYIYFIYAMHYALNCLHRRVSLLNEDEKEENFIKSNEKVVYPFCKNRINNRDDKNQAVLKAIDYLDRFIKILNSKKFDSFILGEEEKERNNPQHIPATELRRRFVELNDRHNTLELKMEKMKELNSKLEEEKEANEKRIKELEQIKRALELQKEKLNNDFKEKVEREKELEKIVEEKKEYIKNLEYTLAEEKTKIEEMENNYKYVVSDNEKIKSTVYEIIASAKKKLGFGYSDEVIDELLLQINKLKSEK